MCFFKTFAHVQYSSAYARMRRKSTNLGGLRVTVTVVAVSSPCYAYRHACA